MNSLSCLFVLVISLSFTKASASSAKNSSVRFNPAAFDFACKLIKQGRFVADKKGGWSEDHPTRAQENDFIRDHGFQEYAKWYLAVDERYSANSKVRYKFPFGDFNRVHRC